MSCVISMYLHLHVMQMLSCVSVQITKLLKCKIQLLDKQNYKILLFCHQYI